MLNSALLKLAITISVTLYPFAPYIVAATAAAAPPSATDAIMDEPPKDPILCIDTGRQIGGNCRLSIDDAGRFLVTASDDKTARVWNARTGAVIRTLRPPIDSGKDGVLDAVAISPDGGLIAVGGLTGHDWDGTYSIYLYSRATGAMIRRIPGLTHGVSDLAFSRDGKYLAAACTRSSGLSVFRVSNGSPAAHDTDYKSSATSLDWDNAGRLVSTCADGYVRLYDSPFITGTAADVAVQPAIKMQVAGMSRMASARFSPDGAKIAVGCGDTPAHVAVLSGKDLSPICQPDASSLKAGANLSTLCWSDNGGFLFAAGRSLSGEGLSVLRRWTMSGAGAFEDLPIAGVNDLRCPRAPRVGETAAASPLFYCTFDSGIGAVDTGGKNLFEARGDFARFPNAFRLDTSEDGSTVRFAYSDRAGVKLAEFSLKNRRLTTVADSTVDPALRAPRLTAKGIAIVDWKDCGTPRLNGKQLGHATVGKCLSLAIAPNTKRLILGTIDLLACYSRRGHWYWSAETPSGAGNVNISGNGKVVIGAFDDGVIRWFKLTKGEPMLSLFVQPETNAWVLWTPDGHYDCSPGGEKLVGWQMNQGRDRAPLFFTSAHFHNTFHRPDLIAKAVAALQAGQVLEDAGKPDKASKDDDKDDDSKDDNKDDGKDDN